MKLVWLKASLFVTVVVLLVGISGTVFADTSSGTVNMMVTVNAKYELEIISGSVVSGVLDPHTITVLSSETVDGGDDSNTILQVKTNSTSWAIQAEITSDI